MSKLFKWLNVALIAVLFLSLSAQSWRLSRAEKELVRVSDDYESYKLEQLIFNELKEQEWINVIEGIDNETNNELQAMQATIDNLAIERDGLRSETARLRAARNSTAARKCAPEYERIRVSSDVLDDCKEKYAAMGGEAEESRIRGFACETSYDSLSK